jgi:hypothetical protein
MMASKRLLLLSSQNLLLRALCNPPPPPPTFDLGFLPGLLLPIQLDTNATSFPLLLALSKKS